MAIEFNGNDTYFGYSGFINRSGANNTFNVDNSNTSDTFQFQETTGGGDFFLDYPFSPSLDTTTEVSLDGGASFVSFSTVEFGLFYSEIPGLTAPFQYVVIDIAGQQYMFIHADGSASNPTINPFKTGNHNPLDVNPVCFVCGTVISTDLGGVPVEFLKVGDLVLTRENGPQVIRWIGSRKMSGAFATRHKPICVNAGALGNGLPKRDLLVSPQHRVLLRDWRAEVMFGASEVLIAAKHLVNDSNIRVTTDLEEFEYFHILFDSHQTIFSEDLPTESFHPGDMAMRSLSEESRAEVLELFPKLANDVASYGPSTHRSLKAFEAKALQSA